jgi:hypothetical protein
VTAVPWSIEEAEVCIVQATDAHLARGGRLLTGSFERLAGESISFCPVRCAVDAHLAEIEGVHALDVISAFGRLTGWTRQEVWSVVLGYDATALESSGWIDPQRLALGERLRARYGMQSARRTSIA